MNILHPLSLSVCTCLLQLGLSLGHEYFLDLMCEWKLRSGSGLLEKLEIHRCDDVGSRSWGSHMAICMYLDMSLYLSYRPFHMMDIISIGS